MPTFPQYRDDSQIIGHLLNLVEEVKRGNVRVIAEKHEDHMRATIVTSFHFEGSIHAMHAPALYPRDLLQSFNDMYGAMQAMPPAFASMQHLIDEFGKNVQPLPPIEELGKTEEVLVGYRDFTIKDGELKSRNSTIWPAREKLQATCRIEPKHVAPVSKCQCGIYAFTTPTHSDMRKTSEYWGEVYLWGDTYICETGFRAQYAYPKSIFVKDNGTRKTAFTAKWLEEEYGVPVFRVHAREGITSEEYVGVMAQAMLRGADILEDRSDS